MTTYESQDAPESDEAELPAKPEIEDMPPEEGVAPPTEEDEEQAEAPDFLDPARAEEDDTIDNAESESYPEEG